MPILHRILETALYCTDPEITAAFYRRLLGTEPLLTSERLVALDAGQGTVLLLFRKGLSADGLPTPGGLVPGHDGSGPSHVAFAIDDAEAWRLRLGELGIGVESEVTWPRGGRSLYFRDPDGRSVELATPGLWASY